jgi:hypothetical protein
MELDAEARFDYPLPKAGSRSWIVLSEFRWPVYDHGYEWITAVADRPGGHRAAPMLARSATGSPKSVYWYEPLREKKALFMTFADTRVTERGILDFVQRFGLLGGPAAVTTDQTRPSGPSGRPEAVKAEPFAAWADRILSMRQAISLWDMVCARDAVGLSEVIGCEQDVVVYRPKPAWLLPDWLPPEAHQPPPVIDLRKKRLDAPCEAPQPQGLAVEAAESLVLTRDLGTLGRIEQLDDLALLEIACDVLTYITGRFLRGAVGSRLLANAKSGLAELVQEPDDLGGSLWLQFAQAAAARTRFRRCTWCGEWYALPLRGARLTREYCGPPCRVEAYRSRQARAVALAAKGVAPKVIARELGTTAAQVRKWLKKHKGA